LPASKICDARWLMSRLIGYALASQNSSIKPEFPAQANLFLRRIFCAAK
jgi:hypothetical protein